jgi:hypothetical protein
VLLPSCCWLPDGAAILCRSRAGDIQQEQHIVAANVTASASHEHASAWLRRYAIADTQLAEIAELAFTQRVTVSDPETIALKFYFQLPPSPLAQS